MRRYLVRQVEKADVDIRLGTQVTSELISQIDPGVVVDATGTIWPGFDSFAEWVRHDGPGGPGPRVLLHGGDKPALSLAERLTTAGHEVTIVEPSGVFGQAIGLPGRFRLVHDLRAAGVRTEQEVPDTTSFDSVIDTTRAEPVPLISGHRETRRVGDVTGSAGLEAAFRTAREVMFTLAT